MLNEEAEYNESDSVVKNNIIFYQSAEDPAIVTLKPTRGTDFSESVIYSFFKEVFLPQGYPATVHKDYLQYQIWDTLQAFASTINGTLTTHSIMRGVGVGESTATPLIAAITWILKDGTGMIGRIIFAWYQGNNLDSQCKKWRFFADILNDTAMVIEVSVPYKSSLSSILFCITTGMKAIVGIAGGATRTAIMQHHALKDNMADVSAKEHSQGTLVNLVGSIVGIIILLFIHEKLFIYVCGMLVIVHIVCNYFAVTSLQINSLNEDRLCLIIQDYILFHAISSVEEINKQESVVVWLQNPARRLFGFDIESGVSFIEILHKNLIKLEDVRRLVSLFQLRKYIPVMDVDRKKIYVILAKDCNDIDILKAYFHSTIFAMIVSKMIGNIPVVLEKKVETGMSYPMMRIFNFSRRMYMIQNLFNRRISYEFLIAIDEIVFAEYYSFMKHLEKSDWILKSNVLPVKPWRGVWE